MRIRRTGTLAVGRKYKEILVDTFLGLNLVQPYTQLKDGVSPYLYNARLYARNSTDRRVAVGTRKGPGFYTTPIGETIDTSQTSTIGASDTTLTTTSWAGAVFVAGASGRLTKVELNLKLGTIPTQHLIVEIYSNSAGSLGTLLAKSSILTNSITSSYAYVAARFTEAPTIVSGTSYWIVAYMQAGGSGSYLWSNTTAATTSKTSTSSGGTWSTTSYALNVKPYVSTGTKHLGGFRYTPSSGTNKTLIAHGTAMYTVNDITGATTAIATGLSGSATDYYFDQSDDKVFWVNGNDVPKYWDGTTVTSVTGSPPNGKFIIFHKNRLFVVDPLNPTKIVYSELGDYNTYASTNFIYAPSPKSGDPITGWVVFQDNLVIFTRKTKYILFGDDPGNFILRQSSGKKGAVNQDVIKADANYIYYLSDDGVYRYNGSADELISDSVQPDVDGMNDKTRASAAIQNNYYRLYYAGTGSTVSNLCLLWDTLNKFWLRDTNTYIGKPFLKEDASLIEGSSLTGTLYYAEQAYSDLGRPIEFKYWTKYFGDGLRKILLRRVIPSIRLQTQPYMLNIYIDIDQRNTIPLQYTVNAQASGNTWGGGISWGSSNTWGSATVSNPQILRGTEAYWHQIRFEQTGVDTPVEILSYLLQIRVRRTE
jgi:hypothetical protein